MSTWTDKQLAKLRILRLAATVQLERVTKPRPKTLDKVPPSAEALTVEWLTAALCKGHPGASVVAYEHGDGTQGSTSRELITVTYNEVGQHTDLPTTIFTKASATFSSRVITGLQGAAANECHFYVHLRPEVDMVGAIAYHAAADARSCRSMVLLEALDSTRGARFGAPGEMYVDRAMAESQARELASLHAAFWNDSRLERGVAQIGTPLEFYRALEAVDLSGAFEKGIDRSRGDVPDELLSARQRLWPATLDSLEKHSVGPKTLLHGDTHLGNWFATPEGTMGLFDWHCLMHGTWALDVVYAFSSGLTTDDRRAWEADLLRVYLDELASRGVAAPTFDDAWLTYRQQAMHGLAWWLVTVGFKSGDDAQGEGDVPDMQPDEICSENIRRLAQTVADLESVVAQDQRTGGRPAGDVSSTTART